MYIDIKKIIANNICMLRNQHNLTQQEFVDKLDSTYARSHLSKIENGSSVPSAQFIRDIAVAFKVDVNWLLTINSEQYPKTNDSDFQLLLKIKQLPEEAKKSLITLINLINTPAK